MKTFLVSVIALFTVSSAAAPVDYFNAVINHNDVKIQCADGAQLLSVSHVMTYRCPGCYLFVLGFDSPSGKYQQSVRTSLNMDTKKIKVDFLVPPPNDGPSTPSAR